MKRKLPLPDAEIALRREATAPQVNAWVSANAGSGKTRILQDRVVRLLLDGVPPDRILCLTFTKAAAAEMQTRIFAELARWIAYDEAELSKAIDDLVGPEADAASPRGVARKARRMQRARQLFAEAVEIPGGLKLQTIHAFAERVLHLFPIEAGVPVDFTVLDDAEASALRAEARAQVLEAANDAPQSELGRAFMVIVEAVGFEGFTKAIDHALPALTAFRNRNPGIATSQAMSAHAYAALLGEEAATSEAEVDAGLIAALPDQADAKRMAELVLADSNATRTVEAAERLMAYARASKVARLRAAQNLIMTGGGEPRKQGIGKPVLVKFPDIAAYQLQLEETAQTYVTARKSTRTYHRSRAMRAFADRVLDAYAQAKAARNALDFDDLIARLRAMLTSGQAAWVMMKLDAAIDHILVDEAQDTTPAMWDIIEALADDFFSGEGQARFSRSIFVVGDEKQSIFSFQGAEPQVFEQVRRKFADKIGALHQPGDPPEHVSKPVRLNYSFRSSADVLGAVDAVFADEARRAGLSAGADAPEHYAAHDAFPGHIEVWPPEVHQPETPTDENAPVDAPKPRAPAILSAERVARTIRNWIDHGARHLEDGKPIAPGDILILTQHRSAFFHAVLRALKQLDIPVAGADRLKLNEEIVIHDLLVIAQAALLPEDDLSLATALKTPIIGLDDAQVEQLCAGRVGVSVRQNLRLAALHDDALMRLDVWLTALEQKAREASPFAFFADLCASPCPTRAFSSEVGNTGGLQSIPPSSREDPQGRASENALKERDRAVLRSTLIENSSMPQISGRKALFSRLGPDAADALDTLLADALAYATRHPASLMAFVAAQARRESEIKRDLDQGEGQVRVMTVHASKGLEARIVFLGDCMRKPLTSREASAFLLEKDGQEVLVWAGKKDDEAQALNAARLTKRAKTFDEYRRLLYVGMTRAADQLFITGFQLQRPRKDKGYVTAAEVPVTEYPWQFLAEAGLQSAPLIEPDNGVLRWHTRAPIAPPIEAKAQGDGQKSALPTWLSTPAPAEDVPLPPLRPSRGPVAGEADPSENSRNADLARRRGILLHRLYEFLPLVEASRRSEVARALIARDMPEMTDAEAQTHLAAILAVLDGASGQSLFGAQSRAEVALAGVVSLADGQTRRVSGRVDRLSVQGERVDFVDIKTGFPHVAVEDQAIMRQATLYRALLATLYPGRIITAHILWTQNGRLETLPNAALDAAFLGITQA